MDLLTTINQARLDIKAGDQHFGVQRMVELERFIKTAWDDAAHDIGGFRAPVDPKSKPKPIAKPKLVSVKPPPLPNKEAAAKATCEAMG